MVSLSYKKTESESINKNQHIEIYVHGSADPVAKISGYGLYCVELVKEIWEYTESYISSWEIGYYAIFKAIKFARDRNIHKLVIYSSNKPLVTSISSTRKSKIEYINTNRWWFRIEKRENFQLLNVKFISTKKNKIAKELAVKALRRGRKNQAGV